MIDIRLFTENDWGAVWQMIEPVFREGKTYAYPTDISEEEAYNFWITKPDGTYVAVDEAEKIVGTYTIKPNQHGNGAHVCTCGYIVASEARGQGIASKMCKHSQQEALGMGFLAMQYNLVVSTNAAAIKVWKRNGFIIIGTVPNAFKHPDFGFIDAFIMYKKLRF